MKILRKFTLFVVCICVYVSCEKVNTIPMSININEEDKEIIENEEENTKNKEENTKNEEEDVIDKNTLSVTLTTPGTISKFLDETDPLNIKNLVINGTMNAVDFDQIKWRCRNLEIYDLSKVKIIAYTGEYGSNEGYLMDYNDDIIPMGACFYWCSNYHWEFPSKLYDEGMKSLKQILLPQEGLKGIDRNAFARAYHLTEIDIPEGVENIGFVAFRLCSDVVKISLPSTLVKIGEYAFTGLPNLTEVYCRAVIPPATKDSFGFLGDSDGKRGYADTSTYKPMSDATLYIPKGSLDKYRVEWGKYFKDIVEYDY